MRTMKFLAMFFIILNLSCVWSVREGIGQDYYAQEDPNKKILKEAVLGAGVGAVASGASGGNAGKGALIGAGTNVIGSAILDTLTSSPAPQQQQVQYVQQPQPQYVQQSQPRIEYTEQVRERTYTPIETAPRRGGCSRNP